MNTIQHVSSVILILGLGGAAASHADTSNATSTATQIPSSGDTVKPGDIIHFRSAAPIFKETTFSAPGNNSPAPTGGGANAENTSCAPPDSVFEVQSITSAVTTSAASTAPSGSSPTPANTQLVYGSFPSGNWAKRALHLFPTAPGENDTTVQTAGPCSGYPVVAANVPYQFDAADLDKVVIQRMGFTWGALVIPYKYYFTDKSIKGNPSTVAYAGYEGWFPGVSLAVVGSAGIGVASNSSSSPTSTVSTAGPSKTSSTGTPSTATSSTSNSTAATYTMAIGFIATFGGSMKGGLMFGRDYQGNGSGFKYDNKTWMALSIGTSF
jgi:hypothetical protein